MKLETVYYSILGGQGDSILLRNCHKLNQQVEH
jgi:hypothetical protein